jgi:hypothetical protein
MSSSAPTARHGAPHRTSATSLQSLPFPVFVCSIARLLVHLGYQQVSIKRPLHGTGKGRNSLAGLDIEAYLNDGLARTRVIVQVKQHQHCVPSSCVDQLRGAMVRHHALQGLLFTAGTFSRAAREAAATSQSLPVRLVEGAELARLLKAQEVPIRADTSSVPLDVPRPLQGLKETVPRDATRQRATDEATDEQAPVVQRHRIPQLASSRVTITLTIGESADTRETPNASGR